MNTEDRKIQWQPIIELAILMFTTLGTTIPLYLHTDSKIDKISDRMLEMKKDSDQKFYELLKEMRK